MPSLDIYKLHDKHKESSELESIECRPFLKWVGGKSQLLPELLARVPRTYANYFEPFLGGGALFFALQPSNAFLSDINEELINAYQVVQSETIELIEELAKHRYEKDYYYQIRNIDRQVQYKNFKNVERAARLIYLNKTCFNGLYRVNSKGEFNTPFGSYKNPKIIDAKNLFSCSRALKSAQISKHSFFTLIDQVSSGDFVYLDPPYVPISNTASFTNYAKEGFGGKEQVQLRDFCIELDKKGAMFMASNSSASSVKDLYSSFRQEIVYASRAINSKGSKRGKTEELIIRNY